MGSDSSNGQELLFQRLTETPRADVLSLRQRLCQRRPPRIRKVGTSGLEARDSIVARVIPSVLERSRSRLPAANFSATSPLAEIFCPQFDVVSTALFGFADSLIELFNGFGAVDAVKTPMRMLFYSRQLRFSDATERVLFEFFRRQVVRHDIRSI